MSRASQRSVLDSNDLVISQLCGLWKIINLTGDGEDGASLLSGGGGGYQGPAAEAGLHDEGSPAEA